MKSILTILFSNATLTKLLLMVFVGGGLWGAYQWKDIRLWWVERQAQSCEVKLQDKTSLLGQCQAQVAQCNRTDESAADTLETRLVEARGVAAPANAEELNAWLDSRFSY